MNSEKAGSASSTGETSKPRPPLPKNLAEADYLAQQAAKARQAMSATLGDMTQTLKEGVDLRAWVQEYPWTSLGAVTALGFLAASAITPSREESFKERLQSLMEEIKPPAAPDAEERAGTAGQKKKPSTAGSIVGHLADALKTALVSTISSAVAAKVQQPAGEKSYPDVEGSGQETPTY